MNLKNKRVLITAGPTWVPIDDVRVISNSATGETGILLAEKLSCLGAKVILVLGPITDRPAINKSIKVIRFNFFDELKNILFRELLSQKYDMVIHSTAVSDYRPLARHRKKVPSGKRFWNIKLVPTEKLIDSIKRINNSLFLVGFKFEPGRNKGSLVKNAKGLMARSHADLIVANTVRNGQYAAWVVSADRAYGPLFSKNALAEKLIRITGDHPWKN